MIAAYLDHLTIGDLAIWSIVVPLVSLLIAWGIVGGAIMAWRWNTAQRQREGQELARRACDELRGMR